MLVSPSIDPVSGSHSKNPYWKLARRSSTHTHSAALFLQSSQKQTHRDVMDHQCIHAVHLFLRFTLALQSCCVWTSYELGVSIHPKYSPDNQMHQGTEMDAHKHSHMYKLRQYKRYSGLV